MKLFILPAFAIVEAIYLIGRRRKFSWLALIVGFFFGGLSYLFYFRGEAPYLVLGAQFAAVVLYYLIRS